MIKRIAPAVFVLLTVMAGAVYAQNLLNNADYQKAVDLRNQAQTALNAGQYDKAKQLSQEAALYAQKAVDLAHQLALGYQATNLLNIAKARINYGETINAASRYPSQWQTAQSQVAVAQTEYNAKAYEKSMTASQAVIDALKNIQPPVVVQAQPVQPSQPAPAPAPAQKVLPQYYTVRLIPSRRDCFWRIAAYPFVYDDPLRWPILYQANKEKLQDPNNPNLIQPGMVFIIPSINGEKRQGTYQPPAGSGQ